MGQWGRHVRLLTASAPASHIRTLLGSPTLVETALRFTVVLSFFLFLPLHGIQQPRRVRPSMCIGGSVLDEAPTISPESLPTSPLIFKGVKKCEIWRHFQRRSTLMHRCLKMQQDISTLKQTRKQR